MAMTSNITWLTFRHFRPSSLGFLPEQISKIVTTFAPPDDTTPKVLYVGPRPKQSIAAALTFSNETKRRYPTEKMLIPCTFRSPTNS